MCGCVCVLPKWVSEWLLECLRICVCGSHQEAGDRWVVDIQSHVLQELRSPGSGGGGEETLLVISTARCKRGQGTHECTFASIRLSVSVPLILTLFCLSLRATYLPACLSSLPLCLVMPPYPTTFNSSLVSLRHTSICLCTLNLSTFFPRASRLPPLITHRIFCDDTCGLFSGKNCLLCLCAVL